jgi:hypothetical protein
MGVISPLGRGVQETRAALEAGAGLRVAGDGVRCVALPRQDGGQCVEDAARVCGSAARGVCTRQAA